MSSLLIVAGAGFCFWLGYVVYAEKIQKLFTPDNKRKTPAITEYDGIDYVPAKHWSMLFGHHFASIAGAAPIVGPVLAVSIWGWAPTLLWIVLGTIFIGGVHDYCSLMISVRHKGHTIADFAESTISRNAKLIFLSFVWITLILIVSVFVNLCASTLVDKPEIVLPSLGLIPIAILLGVFLYAKKNLKKHNQAWATLAALFALGFLIFLGPKLPISFSVSNPVVLWSVILLIYAFIASIAPVQILLQPRDYISAFLLVLGLLFGYMGVIVHRPVLSYPAFTSFSSSAGTMLWPALFVTVACGAISGFHSMVASGTTSKQLPNECYAKRISYGGMISEGLLAVLALLVVAAGFSSVANFRSVVAGDGGLIKAFSFGYGQVTESFLGGFGVIFAVLVLNAFILTTLDTATRIGRYLTQELFKIKNRYIATLVVVSLSGWLSLPGKWKEIWPIFGAANQLIAAFTLIVITSWLLATRKPVRYTLIPTLFMLVTTIGALVFKIIEYIQGGKLVLLTISSVLLVLSFIVLYEAVFVGVRNYRRHHHGKN